MERKGGENGGTTPPTVEENRGCKDYLEGNNIEQCLPKERLAGFDWSSPTVWCVCANHLCRVPLVTTDDLEREDRIDGVFTVRNDCHNECPAIARWRLECRDQTHDSGA